MYLNVGEKWLKGVFLVYLILAIMGSFTFTAGQTNSYEQTNKDILGSNSYFSSIALTIDWLAEDVLIIGKAHKHSNSPLRNGLLRVFTLTGVIGIIMFMAKSGFTIDKNDNYPTIKNLVQLKLRI